MRIKSLVVLSVAALVLGTVLPSGFTAGLFQGAFPAAVGEGPSGTLTVDGGPLTYTAGPVWVINPSSQVGLGRCFDQTTTCNVFTLTVDLPADYEQRHPHGLVVSSIAWPNRLSDFELFVVDEAGNPVSGNSSSNNPETISFPALSGRHVYQVITYPNIVASGDIVTGTLRLSEPQGVFRAATIGPQLGFADHKPADGQAEFAGEPTLDVNPETGAVFFQAGLQTYKVTFDESRPGTSTWEDVSSPFSITTLDPILTGDVQTGRIFVSQLLGATSLLSYTDDEGKTWSPSEGSGIPGGVDHQSVAGGPYPEGFSSLGSYPNAVYYCSQDIFTALCARSDNGGTTFNPPVPIYTTECAGIHGHVKVASDGTVYVPNKGCFVDGDDGQAVIVSEDAGQTWDIRILPNTDAAQGSDPSIGVASDGTLYFGYQSVENRARIAVSHDKGKTWQNDTDVAVPAGVRNIVFPAVAAGDGDRAVFAFHGSTAKGVGYTEGYKGLWYLYVATTFDGGKHWITQNATPNDPVQREGGICLGGIGCSGNNRNLLDFMDVIADEEGRIVVSYADGCTGECIKQGPNPFESIGSIVRQTSGPRLFSEFDPPGTQINYRTSSVRPGTRPAPAPKPDARPRARPLPATGVGSAVSLGLALLVGAFATARLRKRSS